MWYRIVGTSHIASQAITAVKTGFDEFQPDVVAVELDQSRLYALLKQQKPNYSLSMIKIVGVRGYLFAVIGGIVQRKLGKIVNVAPGSDMLAAVKVAKQHKTNVLLIDQHIQITLRKLTKAMGWKEFKQVFRDIWDSIFHREKITFDLNKVPDDKLVEKLLGEFRKRYPRMYKVLVTERNEIMVKNLKKFHKLEPDKKVLVVIGTGHKKGMEQLLTAASKNP